MRKQRSPCTISSHATLPEWLVSTTGISDYAIQPYPASVWPQFLTLDAQILNSSHLLNNWEAGDQLSSNFYLQNLEESDMIEDNNYSSYDFWNPAEPFTFMEQSSDDSYNQRNENPYHPPNLYEQQVLRYGMPSVTNYGAIALLLRHLVRVDLIPEGSVSVYNFPAMSVITLNATGDKCYVKHPNGRVYQEGSVIHMKTGNDRFAKLSPRGITFSASSHSLSYFIDESGAKTTTAKYVDLNNELTTSVFYDGNNRNYEELEQECYRIISETGYQNNPDGSDLWIFGRIHIKQDRWGEVTVSQQDTERTITTSPTIRKVAIESPNIRISIDCYSKNYFTVKKDDCLVTSGFCGLIAQKRTQKAGLDRSGKLVLF